MPRHKGSRLQLMTQKLLHFYIHARSIPVGRKGTAVLESGKDTEAAYGSLLLDMSWLAQGCCSLIPFKSGSGAHASLPVVELSMQGSFVQTVSDIAQNSSAPLASDSAPGGLAPLQPCRPACRMRSSWQ